MFDMTVLSSFKRKAKFCVYTIKFLKVYGPGGKNTNTRFKIVNYQMIQTGSCLIKIYVPKDTIDRNFNCVYM